MSETNTIPAEVRLGSALDEMDRAADCRTIPHNVRDARDALADLVAERDSLRDALAEANADAYRNAQGLAEANGRIARIRDVVRQSARSSLALADIL